MDDKLSNPSRYQLSYWLLGLTATCGELSADLFTKLHESPSYLEAVIRRLKKDKLLQVYYRDKVCSYRLCVKGKDYLLADSYDRFTFYLTGNSYMNILKSELPRRHRLYRLAEVYVLMLGCGIAFSIIPGIYEQRLTKEPTLKLNILMRCLLFILRLSYSTMTGS